MLSRRDRGALSPQQSANPGERLRAEADGAFQLVIAFEDVLDARASQPIAPSDEAARQRPMRQDRDGKIAAVENARSQRLLQAFAAVASANWNAESAAVAVKVWVAVRHSGEDVKIFWIEQTALGSAMRRDDG